MYKVLMSLLCISLFACQMEQKNKAEVSEKYPDHLGEIKPDAQIDKPNFKLCDSTALVQSRLALSYEGGFAQLEKECKEVLIKSVEYQEYSGYVMVRFIINCHKETGRFRFQTFDDHFLEQDCPQALKEQVQGLIEGLDQWVFLRAGDHGKDHSKYLNFKFNQGQLISVIH